MYTPHYMLRELTDSYKRVFDDGWDAYRKRVFRRQKELGLIPENMKRVTDTPVPYSVEEGYQLNRDLANDCIDWMRRKKAISPNRGFFAYFSPGAAPCPPSAPSGLAGAAHRC